VTHTEGMRSWTGELPVASVVWDLYGEAGKQTEPRRTPSIGLGLLGRRPIRPPDLLGMVSHRDCWMVIRPTDLFSRKHDHS